MFYKLPSNVSLCNINPMQSYFSTIWTIPPTIIIDVSAGNWFLTTLSNSFLAKLAQRLNITAFSKNKEYYQFKIWLLYTKYSFNKQYLHNFNMSFICSYINVRVCCREYRASSFQSKTFLWIRCRVNIMSHAHAIDSVNSGSNECRHWVPMNGISSRTNPGG